MVVPRFHLPFKTQSYICLILWPKIYYYNPRVKHLFKIKTLKHSPRTLLLCLFYRLLTNICQWIILNSLRPIHSFLRNHLSLPSLQDWVLIDAPLILLWWQDQSVQLSKNRRKRSFRYYRIFHYRRLVANIIGVACLKAHCEVQKNCPNGGLVKKIVAYS